MDLTAESVARALGGASGAGAQWSARCPAHEDRQASLSLTQAGDRLLCKCHAGCAQDQVVGELRARGLWPAPRQRPARSRGEGRRRPAPDIARTYDYHGPAGDLRYQVVRLVPKSFRQRRPDPDRPGRWIWKMAGQKLILYRLPQVLAARDAGDTIWVVEGEKDADRLASLGWCATCSPAGAGKWRSDYAGSLGGAQRVVVIPDADAPGRAHARDILRSLDGRVADLRVLELDVPEKADVSDWLDTGGSAEDLLRLAEAAPQWDPKVHLREEAPEARPEDGGAPPARPAPPPGPPGEGEAPRVLSRTQPWRTARSLLDDLHVQDGHRTLHHQQGEWLTWAGTRYQEVEDLAVMGQTYGYLDDSWCKGRDGSLAPFDPNKSRVGDVLQALRARTHVDKEVEEPSWLGDPPRGAPPAKDLIPLANGLLRLEDRKLLDHDPRFFCRYSLPFAYEPGAGCEWFQHFLASLWGDQERVDLLQEVFGYLLSQDTSQQKIFLLLGPPRAGKGTLARLLEALLGSSNLASTSPADLADKYGMTELIGRRVAIMPDARFGIPWGSLATLTSRLLSVSGEDRVSIQRKYISNWTGRLGTRIVISTNDMPRFGDASGALARRFIVLRFDRSFLGQEDTELERKVLAELPGIFNWALDGLDRLRRRGRFQPPQSSEELVTEMEEQGAPLMAFVRDKCVLEGNASVDKDDLYTEYKRWCEEEGQRTLPRNTMMRELYSAYRGRIAPQKGPVVEGRRARRVAGIRIYGYPEG